MIYPSSRRLRLDQKLLESYRARAAAPWKSLPFWARLGIHMTGLHKSAFRGYLDFQLREHHWQFPNLPAEFDGFRILHLSDLHLGLHPNFLPILTRKLKTASADICAITGDFVDHPGHAVEETRKQVSQVVQALRMPVYGSPGNHDVTPTLEAVAAAGVSLLVNRLETLHSGGGSISLCGLDDPHYYQTHCWNSIEGAGFRLLLAHSPEIFRELESSRQISLCLSGHTHGGQLRLPLVGALLRRCSVPRRLVWGPWKVGHSHGYTSSGTGASAVPFRLNCPPEIVIHTLHQSL